MKKTIGVGLLAGLCMLIANFAFGIIFQVIFPKIQAQYMNANLFRSWNDPLMYLLYICVFIVGVIFAFLWEKHKNLLPGSTSYQKVLKLTMIYFVFSVIGMTINYSTFQVSLLMTINWIIGVFLQVIVGAWVISKMIK